MANLGISSNHVSNKLTISSCPSTMSNFFSDCHPFYLRNGGTVYTRMKQRKLCCQPSVCPLQIGNLMVLSNLQKLSMSKTCWSRPAPPNTNVKMKREIVPDFSSALPHWPVNQIFSRIKSWSHGGADVGLIPVVFIGRNLCDCQMSVTET